LLLNEFTAKTQLDPLEKKGQVRAQALGHKIGLAIIIVLIFTGVVAGLVYAPGSPGLPYLSPTYQAQRVIFQHEGPTTLGVIHEVLYVPDSPTLILILGSNGSQTRYSGIWTYGGTSARGVFPTPVTISNARTYLAIPANPCPAQSQIPAAGYEVHLGLYTDTPLNSLIFKFTCVKGLYLGAVTLGNPHIIIPNLAPPNGSGQESLNLTSYVFQNGTNVTLVVKNTGSVGLGLVGYYVKDTSNNQYYSQTYAGPSINTGATANANILINSACSGCTLSGAPFLFTAARTYFVMLLTARNNLIIFAVTE